MSNTKVKMVSFEDLLRSLPNDSEIATTELMEKEITKGKFGLISVGNVIMNSQELINKLARVELTMLKQGSKAANDKWFELNLPIPRTK